MVDAEEKAAFAQYASTSGASALLSKAVVALSRAVVNPKSPLSPDSAGTFLRDALHGAEEQPEHTVLDEKEKEKVSSFLTSSGTNDIIARALVALFDESPRPPSSVAFLRAYFAAEFGQPAGTGELDRGSELAPGADSAAPASTAELHGEEQPAEPVSEPAAMAVHPPRPSRRYQRARLHLEDWCWGVGVPCFRLLHIPELGPERPRWSRGIAA